MTTQNLWDSAKAVLRRWFIAIQSYLKKKKKALNRQPNSTPKAAGKRRTKNPKISRRKEIIKIRAEINEKEMKETIVKINKTKSWFFEKINKITSFSQTHQEKKERRIKSTKLKMKKERIQQTMQEYKGL